MSRMNGKKTHHTHNILEHKERYDIITDKSVCCVCVIILLFILDVRLVDVPAGVTQEKGHTGFLHLPSAVLALIFLARRIRPFLSLVDRKVEFSVLTN